MLKSKMLVILSLFLLASWVIVRAAKTPPANEVSVAWNVTVVGEVTKGKQVRIISQVCGHARRGKIHAILGPSGSGKTTLLNALAGKAMYAGRRQLSTKGIIRFSTESNPIFVEQEDLLFTQLTARETLETSMALNAQRDSRISESVHPIIVDRMLSELGLTKVQDTKVGDAKTRGLSGGEKKRLAIGNEVISDTGGTASSVVVAKSREKSVSSVAVGHSRYLFADEPTSGLDCFQAERVVFLLQQLASRSNSTVILSIHQPRASICSLFDDLTLMSEGGVVYSGPAKSMSQYFSSQGFPCPASSSPFEYYLDLVSVDYTSPEAAVSSRDIIQALINAFAARNAQVHAIVMESVEDMQREAALQRLNARYNGHDRDSTHNTSHSANDTAANITARHVAIRVYHRVTTRVATHIHSVVKHLKYSLRKFRTLYVRACRTVIRDRALNIARLASSLFSALLFGAIYFRMGDSAATVPDRLGLLQVAAVNTAMTSLIKATTSFVSEKLIVQKERSKGAYGVVPYFFAKMCAEVPVSSLYPCLSAALMYKLCGLNAAQGRLERFILILVMEALASSALGMSIAALVPSVEAGVAVAPAVMVVFIVFGGLYVVNTPAYLAWLPKISLIRWAYEALCVNEFSGLALRPLPDSDNGASTGTIGTRPSLRHAEHNNGGRTLGALRGLYVYGLTRLGYSLRTTKQTPPSAAPPADAESRKVLHRMGFSGSTVRATLLAQLAIILCNYVFTCAVLMRQKPSFGTSQAHINGRKFRLTKDDGGGSEVDVRDARSSNSTMVSSEGASSSSRKDGGSAVTTAGAGTKRGYFSSVFGFRGPSGGQVKPISSFGSMSGAF